MFIRSSALMAIILAGAVGSSAAPAPPETTPPLFSTVSLSTGVRMHFAEQGPAGGETVILLHGYSDSWFSFSRIMPLLPSTYRVFALDLRGHGRTDAPRTGYGMDDLASDVIAFMDAKGIVHATIVGHSMGGFVAQQVALAAPRRVSRLVILSSARTPRAFNGIDEFKAVVDSLPDPVPEEFVTEFQQSTLYRPVPDDFFRGVVSESLRLPVHVWRGIMDGLLEGKAATAVGRAGIPSLVLWGEKDAWPPRAEQDSLVAMLRTATLKVYRDMGHAPHWEQPDEVARDLRTFIDGTPAARP
jgi:pimeloyl-ACP methyl ester carboxylesterase